MPDLSFQWDESLFIDNEEYLNEVCKCGHTRGAHDRYGVVKRPIVRRKNERRAQR